MFFMTNKTKTALSWLVYSVVALCVLYPLFVKKGYPFGLDMSFGPQMKVPDEAFGLGREFGRRVPTFVWLAPLSRLVPPEVLVRALLWATLASAGISARAAYQRLVRSPKESWIGGLYAGLLYELNPFVYQRLAAGHWHILLGYALLPLAIVAALQLALEHERSREGAVGGRGNLAAYRKALGSYGLWSVLLAVSSFAMSIVVLLAAALAAILVPSSRRPIGHKARRVVLVAGVWTGANACWIAPSLLKAGSAGEFSDLDFRSFLIRGRDSFEALLNAVRLAGFYRDDLAPPGLNTFFGWLAAGCVLALTVHGAFICYRRVVTAKDDRQGAASEREHRRQSAVASFGTFALLVVLPPTFLALALGERAPLLGPLLAWVYPRLPGWQAFREPQKLLAPVAFAYAVLGGVSLDRWSKPRDAERAPVSRRGIGHSIGWQARAAGASLAKFERWITAAVAVAVPFAFTPGILFGLGGRLVVSEFPASWVTAAQHMHGARGKLLVFPWHQHMSFRFTGGKTNVDPSQDFFPLPTVGSLRVEFPGFDLGIADPVDAYVRDILGGSAALTDLSEILVPLGAEYVVVHKTADWQAYSFLERVSGLTKLQDDDDLVLYHVTAFDRYVDARRIEGETDRDVGPQPDEAFETPPVARLGPSESRCKLAPSPGNVRAPTPFLYDISEPGCWIVPQVFRRGWVGRAHVSSGWGGTATVVFAEGPAKIFYLPSLVGIGGFVLSAAVLVWSVMIGRRNRAP